MYEHNITYVDRKIINHFKKVDPVLFKAFANFGILVVEPIDSKGYFKRLCREIINQQLSDKVGDIIYLRFEALFSGDDVNPKKVFKFTEEDLRSTGMSYSKVRFIRGLAKEILDGNLILDNLEAQDNDYITSNLTKVKGIGKWTAEMFLIFCLGREDIFSFGDLGLKKAIINLYNLKNPKREDLEIIVNKWSPYKSYACRILWKTLD